MARKEENTRSRGIMAGIGTGIGATIASAIRESVLDVTTQVSESAEAFLLRVEDRTIAMEKRVLHSLAAFFLMSLAVLFIVLGAFYFFTENLGIAKAYVFGVLGIILLIAGLLFKGKSR